MTSTEPEPEDVLLTLNEARLLAMKLLRQLQNGAASNPDVFSLCIFVLQKMKSSHHKVPKKQRRLFEQETGEAE